MTPVSATPRSTAMPGCRTLAPREGLLAFWQTGMSIPPVGWFLARLSAGAQDWRQAATAGPGETTVNVCNRLTAGVIRS